MLVVLRLGHRLPRDERITTHVALVARAFGAGRLIYAGQHDSGFEESIGRVVSNWGGDFQIEYSKNPLKTAKEYKKSGYKIAHLTMYGIPLPEKEAELRKILNLLVIVGAEQVPAEFYEIADFNLSLTSQPHSEVAALAIALDRIMGGKELSRTFSSRFAGKMEIIPSEKGKKVRKP
ncbi:MAG: tRNA (cytidine(56)-2'-O)-methyltransferase [Candidatus ainarchaeum sp.]|nr:tRNA (cytidine(56)-2'-O)-methyltransferase [Candidatus ainarchaeum sp.]